MAQSTEKALDELVRCLSLQPSVMSAGMSGHFPLPLPGQGDIDLFIYCRQIPQECERAAILEGLGNSIGSIQIGVFQGGPWGVGDSILLNGIETWLMYFTIEETMREVEALLRGDRLDREGYYYPIGRLAMLSNIQILHDKEGFLEQMKVRLQDYPEDLARSLLQYHLGKLNDIEDLERAVARKDVFFYHFALEFAIDHFLQALFALNREYFPSRKRTAHYVLNFHIAPELCIERLLEVIALGSNPEYIAESYQKWEALTNNLRELVSI